MKKCKIKAPKYAFGAQQISGLLQAGGNIAQGFNSGNQTAQAVFGGVDAVGDAVGAINPLAGAVVKGVAGLGKIATSVVGTKGSVDEVTGEITEGTGILGRKNRNKLKQQSGIVKNNIAAAQNSQQFAADYYQQHGYNGVTMVANGGIIPNTLAYLDDGELIRTPDGAINEIPEEGKPEDSNLMNVPVGTQVLSDKLKVPGTNKTFAERGKEIMATKKQKGKDKYAENSAILNARNAQIAYDELLALQESIKKSKGKKINKYAEGTDDIPEPIVMAEDKKRMKNIRAVVNPNYNPNIKHSKDLAKQSWYTSNNPNAYTEAADAVKKFLMDKTNYDKAYNTLSNLPQIKKNTNKGMSFADAVYKNVQDGLYGQVHDYFSIEQANADLNPIAQERSSLYIPSIKKESKISIPETVSTPDSEQNKKSKSFFTDDFINGLVGTSAGLIGPISNMTAKRGETNVPYMYTPKYSPTEWNIDPMLTEINRSNAIARYNQSRLSPNTGAGLAFGIQSAVARNEAMSRAYAEKNNMENQMAMQNAGIYNDAARYNTQARHTAAVENAQDRAAVDNARRLGLSQLDTALQTMSRDKRLSKRDTTMLNAMIPYLEYGMTKEQLTTLLNDLR